VCTYFALLHYMIIGCTSHNQMTVFMATVTSPCGAQEQKVCHLVKIVRTILFEKEHVNPWVCQKQPLSVNRNATFIVDLSHLPSKKDVLADDTGVWEHTGSPSQYFEVRKNRFGGLMEIVSLGQKCPKKLSCDMYQIPSCCK